MSYNFLFVLFKTVPCPIGRLWKWGCQSSSTRFPINLLHCMESRMEYIVCCKSSARDCHVRNSHWSCDPTIHYNLPKMQYSLVIHNIYLDSPVKKSAKSNGTCCLTAIVEVCLIGGHIFWQCYTSTWLGLCNSLLKEHMPGLASTTDHTHKPLQVPGVGNNGMNKPCKQSLDLMVCYGIVKQTWWYHDMEILSTVLAL